jgi:hypothetical protein
LRTEKCQFRVTRVVPYNRMHCAGLFDGLTRARFCILYSKERRDAMRRTHSDTFGMLDSLLATRSAETLAALPAKYLIYIYIYIYPQSVRTLTRRAVCMMLHIIILTSSCKIRHMYVPCVSHLPSQRGGVYTCRR